MGIVVVTGGLILFYKQKSSEVSLRDFNNPVVETAPPVLEPLSVAPGTTPAASNSPSGGLTSGSDKDSPKNKNLHLLIQAIDRSWISVVIDNGVTKEFSLRPDDKVSLDAENFFVLNIGNAGGIKITLNGKPVGPFGKKGEIVRGIKLESG